MCFIFGYKVEKNTYFTIYLIQKGIHIKVSQNY
jgi:hypothetical protein